MGKTCHYGLFIALITIFSNATLNAAAEANNYSFAVANADGKTIYYNITEEAIGGSNGKVTVTYLGTTSGEQRTAYTESLVIPSTVEYSSSTYDVTAIDEHAFYYCTQLTSITIPESVTSIGEYAFANTTIGEMDLSSLCITSIPGHAFYGSSSLTSVTLPTTISTIGEYAFSQCTSLTTLEGFSDLTELMEISAYTFQHCDALTSITLPSCVTTIDEHAFYNSGIEDFEIPENVTSVGGYAFASCSSLEKFTYNATTNELFETSVFNSSASLTELTIGESVELIPYNLYYLSTVGTINFNAANAKLPNECYSDGSDRTSFWKSVFTDWHKLTKVVIGSTVESLDDYMFEGCPMTELDIDNTATLTKLGDNVFQNCSLLSTLKDFEGLTNLQTIPTHAFSGCTSLAEITIPENVTTIEDHAFYETGISEITIPKNVTTIGDYAFGSCESLATVDFNAQQIEELSTGAFQSCSLLTTLTIDKDVELIPQNFKYLYYLTTLNYNAANAEMYEDATQSDFANLSSLTEVNIGDKVETIPEKLFSGCSYIETVNISGDNNVLTTIGAYAFYNCHNTALTEIEAPSSVETIEEHAFDGCSSLETLILSGATSVDGTAFYRCTSLKTLNLASVTLINSDWFTDCKSTLETLILSSVTSVPDQMFSTEGAKDEDTKKYAFTCNFPSLKIVDISGAESIGLGAFGACTSLEQVTLGSNLTEIKSMAFQECSSMTTIGSNLSSVTLIGDDAFYGCEKLGYIDESNSLYELDLSGITDYNNLHPNAFEDCKNITAVKLSDNLTVIQNQTFADCNALVSVYTSEPLPSNTIELPTSLTKIEYQAFENCYALAGSLDFEGTSVTEIQQKAFHNCYAITSVNMPGTINSKTASNSIAYQLFQGCSALTSVTFYGQNKTIETIEHMAFASCTNLPTIDIPSTVKTIDYQAFQYCTALNNITLPDVLETIGYNAFDGCTTLSSITIPSSVTTWPEGEVYSPEGNYAFANCTKLSDVTLEDGLETIGSYTFYNCTALEEIKLPTSIETLYEGAFKECTKLATVYELKTLTSAADIPEAQEDCFSGVSDYCFLVVPEDYAEYYDSYRSTHATVDYWSGIPYMREETVKIPITTDEGYVTKYSPYSYVLDSDNDVQCGEITGAAQNGNLTIDWKYSTEGTTTIPPCSALLVKATKGDDGYGTDGTFHIPTTNTNDYKDKSITNTTVGNTGMLYGTVNKDYGTINVPDDDSNNYYFYKLSYYTNEYGDTSLGFYWCDDSDSEAGMSGEGSAFNLSGGDTYNSGLELAWLAIPKSIIDDGTAPSPIKKFYSLDGSDDSDIEEDFNADLEEGTEDTGETVIYNLAGMRVSEMSGKGIYIVNGKKVVKR